MNLKPCPFCGTEVFAKDGETTDITYFLCLPTEGGCGAIMSFTPYKMGDKAAEAFNQRATPTTGEKT